MYKEVTGNLITLAKEGNYDVISHGCNCWNSMGAGIAPQMADAFGCNKFPMESAEFEGNVNKLGQIDIGDSYVKKGEGVVAYAKEVTLKPNLIDKGYRRMKVVNAYTQFGFGINHTNGTIAPVDYEAITLCLRKMNYRFLGADIGLPQIGSGLAGGDWVRIKKIIQTELRDCNVTVVIYKPEAIEVISSEPNFIKHL